MIDRTSKLPIKRQCAILDLPRSTAYDQPSELSEADHALMRRIDELHLTDPFAGSRMLRGMLKQAGHEVGRRHVRTLMRKMGIEAVYRKPNTSRKHEENKVYPYLLRDLAIVRANQVWAADISVPQKAA